MSRKFDEAVDAAWGKFEEQLAARVRSAQDGYLEIEPAEGEDSVPFVAVDWDEDGLEAELIGLSADLDFEAVAALGWQPPEDPDESPFWQVTLPADEAEVLAGMVSGSLRYVFGVADPVFVTGAGPQPLEQVPPRSAGADDEAEQEREHEPVFGFPSNAEELVEMVQQTLAVRSGPEVLRDSDGDFPIHTGVVPLWVRVHEDAPLVRMFSFVAGSIRDRRQARIEVEILNRRTSLLKFTLEDNTITAYYELPAAPFVGPQLLHVVDRVSELLNEVAADTALRVGGKLWFDELAESADDLGESA